MNNQEFMKCYAWTKLHKITLKLAWFFYWIGREYDYFTMCNSGSKMILHHGCLTRPLVVFPVTGSHRVTKNFKLISPGSTCGLTWCLAILTMWQSGQAKKCCVVWSEHLFFFVNWRPIGWLSATLFAGEENWKAAHATSKCTKLRFWP